MAAVAGLSRLQLIEYAAVLIGIHTPEYPSSVTWQKVGGGAGGGGSRRGLIVQAQAIRATLNVATPAADHHRRWPAEAQHAKLPNFNGGLCTHRIKHFFESVHKSNPSTRCA